MLSNLLHVCFKVSQYPLYYFCRTFLQPCPPDRIVLDAVSDLNREIILSLKYGSVRRISFNLMFRRDVFNFCLKIMVGL